ncbi:phosphotriesterase-related protein [Nocardia sp. NBC_00881]|uniref:phosphotriesterase family protein n=1 Tax=Nocardia sp. NBC_00881 TaxID=2975995 RepID=UPI0038678EE9|nr:phosphotriesterase-related protein [Nocardia sp. NBC_00881]
MTAVQTVTGPVPVSELGMVLPHEHLFNELAGARDQSSHKFTEFLTTSTVAAAAAWALRHDPYCCLDNLTAKPVDEVVAEITEFADLGGRTIVDATSSAAIGRNPDALVKTARRTGLNIVMGCGAYLEKSEGRRITATTVDALAYTIADELAHGVGPDSVKPGIIGEIGVSPGFTPAEHASLRAAALAQLDHPTRALMIHLPGWQRRAHEVLDIVVDQIGVAPQRVVLAHMDPSAADTTYQLSVAERGVWLEFDMIGMDITFPHEGRSPDPELIAAAVANLVTRHPDQILLSHDVFLKQMWTRNGGNGFVFIPTVFADMLTEQGINPTLINTLLQDNPARMLTGHNQTETLNIACGLSSDLCRSGELAKRGPGDLSSAEHA